MKEKLKALTRLIFHLTAVFFLCLSGEVSVERVREVLRMLMREAAWHRQAMSAPLPIAQAAEATGVSIDPVSRFMHAQDAGEFPVLSAEEQLRVDALRLKLGGEEAERYVRDGLRSAERDLQECKIVSNPMIAGETPAAPATKKPDQRRVPTQLVRHERVAKAPPATAAVSADQVVGEETDTPMVRAPPWREGMPFVRLSEVMAARAALSEEPHVDPRPTRMHDMAKVAEEEIAHLRTSYDFEDTVTPRNPWKRDEAVVQARRERNASQTGKVRVAGPHVVSCSGAPYDASELRRNLAFATFCALNDVKRDKPTRRQMEAFKSYLEKVPEIPRWPDSWDDRFMMVVLVDPRHPLPALIDRLKMVENRSAYVPEELEEIGVSNAPYWIRCRCDEVTAQGPLRPVLSRFQSDEKSLFVLEVLFLVLQYPDYLGGRSIDCAGVADKPVSVRKEEDVLMIETRLTDQPWSIKLALRGSETEPIRDLVH